ncbi:conserved hypothetical protein [Theileria equi strain WA]|uniref:Uncharacterized protein n=1 Tax=Theileria equi strain WA TaxID=1537102 RepID=L1LCC0_THEEQ|nr:conserved hypothetical protein [Theileria equi strain WA]EKX72793.1 conserved hypothetical protein [Theileria equi strain WA]|eukprot:XP_004832245.1 conserved hypothetical protein [Theileria equi strain WA]
MFSQIRAFSRLSQNRIAQQNVKGFKNLYDLESLEIAKVFSEKIKGDKKVVNKNGEPESTSFPSVKEKRRGARVVKNESLQDYNFAEVVEPKEPPFESLKKNPLYHDLTHVELQQIQELQARSRIGNPYNALNKNKVIMDPVRDAKALVKEFKYEDDEDVDRIDRMIQERNRFDEIVSRIRTKIRQEKKENTAIHKAMIPSISGVVVDPIRKHVMRRAARIGTLLHTHIEQIFTANNPEFLYSMLNGASITINHVEMATSKSVVKCFYTILSEHDSREIQPLLDKAAPRVRFLIARKLELGYTPPVRFIEYRKRSAIKDLQKTVDTHFLTPMEGKIGKSNSSQTRTADKGLENKIQNETLSTMSEDTLLEMQGTFHRRYSGFG